MIGASSILRDVAARTAANVRFRPIADTGSRSHHQAMRLRDYYFGQEVRLTSRHAPRIVAERINAAAASSYWPFHTDAVVGGIRLGRLRLRFVRSPFEYNAKPVLAGRLREIRSGSLLMLRYRAPFLVYVFDVVWFCFWGMVILAMLGQFGERNPDLTKTELTLIWASLLAMLVTPLALHYVGTRKSDEELGYLLDFLAERIDAKP